MKLARRQPRGTALVATLVCLLVVMAILGNMLVGALRIRRQLHVERDRQQCELLLQAGLDRATLSLSAAEDYTGEVWDAPAAEIGGSGDGRVTIRVSRQGESAPQVYVHAEYPVGTESSICRSHTAQLQSTTPLPKE